MRLDRFICKSTQLTREEARNAVIDGRVVVNDLVDIHEAYQVHENNTITLDGQLLTPRPSRYIMLHKPAGFISSNVDARYPSLFHHIDISDKDNLHIAGRLDRDTTGLVLITDDGRWSFNIISPDTHCPKRYRVTLRNPITEQAIEQLQNGVLLDGLDTPTRPAIVDVITEQEVCLTITEGKYHQVKRMFAAVRNKVVGLHREKVGNLTLDIPVGQWRYLTSTEVNYFQPVELNALPKPD